MASGDDREQLAERYHRKHLAAGVGDLDAVPQIYRSGVHDVLGDHLACPRNRQLLCSGQIRKFRAFLVLHFEVIEDVDVKARHARGNAQRGLEFRHLIEIRRFAL